MTSDPDHLLSRTHGCGLLTEADAGRGIEVVLTGWVHRRRDLGQLVFVELRDPTGTVQLVFDPSENAQAHAVGETLRLEDVIGIRGRVRPREAPNPEHPTGMIEVRAGEAVLHNRAENVAFPIAESGEVNEETRLTHRYLDLRRPRLQHNLRTRHRLGVAARRILDGEGFLEIETPMLTRSTPEGARDFLVPSRVHPGRFFALPQSPQLFKQLLMVAGFERYYQIARCFRDEDLRADRQPEFTQIDMELSFATRAAITAVVERLIVEMFGVVDVTVAAPFPRMDYREAIDRFGIDRPDTRFGMELRDVGDAALESGFRVFDDALAAGGAVRGIPVPGGAAASRKQLDGWTAVARKHGARGLVWIKLGDGGVTSSALKVLGEPRCERIAEALGAARGDAALVVADGRDVCNAALAALRLHVARELEVARDGWNLLWVENFPLFLRDAAADRWDSVHHPFTAPHWDEVALLDTDPGAIRSQAYDLVLNGTELGGGSIRIHRSDVQEKVFRVLRISPDEARARFGFLLRGLEAGAPPHGGIALGFDRICALLCGEESIRDVIAFPKTTSAACLMTEAPAAVDLTQLAELKLRLDRDEPAR